MATRNFPTLATKAKELLAQAEEAQRALDAKEAEIEAETEKKAQASKEFLAWQEKIIEAVLAADDVKDRRQRLQYLREEMEQARRKGDDALAETIDTGVTKMTNSLNAAKLASEGAWRDASDAGDIFFRKRQAIRAETSLAHEPQLRVLRENNFKALNAARFATREATQFLQDLAMKG